MLVVGVFHCSLMGWKIHRETVRIQTVDQGWNGSFVVRVGEQDQLFVDEVVVGEVPGLRSIQVLLREQD